MAKPTLEPPKTTKPPQDMREGRKKLEAAYAEVLRYGGDPNHHLCVALAKMIEEFNAKGGRP